MKLATFCQKTPINSVDAKLLGSDVYIEEYTFFQKVLSK